MRRVVLGTFIFALAFGLQNLIAKEKYQKNKNIITAACKVKINAHSKKSRIRRDKIIKQKQIPQKDHIDHDKIIKRKSSRSKKSRINHDKKKKKSVWSKFFIGNKKDPKIQTKKRRAKKAKWREEINKHKHEADYQKKLKQQSLVENQNKYIKDRQRNMGKWRIMRAVSIEQDYEDGRYADLYKRPAWPFYMLWADNRNLLQVKSKFEHATNWFDSSGSTKDLTAREFGEQDFYWRDILLALDLNKRTVGNSTVLGAVSELNYPWKHLKDYLYNKKLIFFGSENKLNLDINYGRYIKDKDVFIGIEIPFAYKKTRLKFDTDVAPCNGVNDAKVNDVYVRTYQQEIFDYVLRAKNLYYYPKMSTIGIGDISTLINFNVRTKFVEKLEWGSKIVWPTSKDRDTKKLFAPEIGYGFTQFKVFSSVMFNKQNKYFNPHMFAEFAYSWQGHKNKRVPKIINTNSAIAGDLVGADVMALGNLVTYAGPLIAFSEPDTRVVAFADNVKSVKIRPGMEFNVRFGNIFEKIIFRRAFLDIYYDFKAKLKDVVLNSGIIEAEWQIRRIEENTMGIQHKAGFNFNYQFDIHSRLNFGAEYIFAGLNVSDTFNAILGLDVEF